METEDLAQERNRERAEKLDDIARRTRQIDANQPLGRNADDVALIRPDEDLLAIEGALSPGPKEALSEQATGASTENDQASERSRPNQAGSAAESVAEAAAERTDDWFDPFAILDAPGSLKWDEGFNPASWTPQPLEDPTPIDEDDDFAFTVLANELASTVRMLRQPSSRFRCLKAKLTKTSLILSAFDGGCFAEGTIDLFNDPIGIGTEAIVFLLSAPELDAACSASGLTVHIRVSYALKRAWFKSGKFERPLVLQSKRAYLDRTTSLLGQADDETKEEIDAAAMLIASTRLSTILNLDEKQEGCDFIAFEDRASSCTNPRAFGFIKHKKLPAQRLIVLAKHVAFLQDILPNASTLARHRTSKYEVFHNDRIKFGFERVVRDRKTLELRKEWLENSSTVRLPRPHLIRFLEANRVAKSKAFRIRADQEGACTIELIGDVSQGRQASMRLDGRFEPVHTTKLDEHVLMSPLLDLLAQAKAEQLNIELNIKQDYVHVALIDIHDVETTYIIASPRTKDLSNPTTSAIANDNGNVIR